MESVQSLFAQAEELKQLGRPEGALAEYGDLIDAYLGGIDSYLQRAFLLRDLGRYAEAQADFRRASDLEPWNGWPALRLAQMLREIDRPRLAAAWAKVAVDRQPDMAEIRLNASVIFASLDWLDLAYAVVRPLPRDMGDWWGHVRAQSEADWRERRADTLRRLGERRTDLDAARELAIALLSLGRTRVVRRWCEQRLRAELAEFSDFDLYARVLAREGGLEHAVASLKALRFLFEANASYAHASARMRAETALPPLTSPEHG
jgi:tetratricopeptide (TPR) repeat protein